LLKKIVDIQNPGIEQESGVSFSTLDMPIFPLRGTLAFPVISVNPALGHIFHGKVVILEGRFFADATAQD
jgi:hypothetical protein